MFHEIMAASSFDFELLTEMLGAIESAESPSDKIEVIVVVLTYIEQHPEIYQLDPVLGIKIRDRCHRIGLAVNEAVETATISFELGLELNQLSTRILEQSSFLDNQLTEQFDIPSEQLSEEEESYDLNQLSDEEEFYDLNQLSEELPEEF
jgi:hypothetical protein